MGISRYKTKRGETRYGVNVYDKFLGKTVWVGTFRAKEDAKVGCLPDRQYCRDQATTDAADRATTLAWVSTVTMGIAALGAIGMLVVPLRTSGDRAAVRASALPGGGSLDLSGRF